MANLTTLAASSSVVITVTEQQSIVLNNGRTDKARLQITTGPNAGAVVADNHLGRRVYGPFGAGTITLSAIVGDVRYELSGDDESPLGDDYEFTSAQSDSLRSLVSGALNPIAAAVGAAYPITEPSLVDDEWPTGALYYIDTSATSNGSGTEASPFNSWANAAAGTTWAADARGKSWLFKRGTTCSEDLGAWGNNGATWANAVRLGAYGDPSQPRPIINGAARANALLISNKDYWIVEDLHFIGGTNAGLAAINNTTRACKYVRVRRCSSFGGGFGGITLVNSAYSPAPSVDVIFSDCWSDFSGQSGVAINCHADGCILLRCKATRASQSSSGWGVYQAGNGQTFISSGWTLVTGTTYTRTLTYPAAGVDNIAAVWSPQSGGNQKLTLAASAVAAQASAGLYFYDVASRVLTINLGTNPNSGTAVAVVYQINNAPQILDCEGSETSASYDGVGVGMDRGVVGGVIVGAYGHDCPGEGVQANQCEGIKIRASRVERCSAGIGISSAHGEVQVIHNSVRKVGTAWYPTKAATLLTGYVGDTLRLVRHSGTSAAQFRNNAVSQATIPLRVELVVAPTPVVGGNLYWNAGSEVGASSRRTVAVDPAFTDGMRIGNAAAFWTGDVLRSGSGLVQFTDGTGRNFAAVPTPGAFEAA